MVRVAEPELDAVTGLSGSGPAYVMLVAEAMIEAGVLVGLPRPVAAQLVEQTLLGSATLLARSDDGPEALRAAVTSPGGTTAAGLRALEMRAVRAAFVDAVVAATERSRELGSSELVIGRRAWRRPDEPQSVAAAAAGLEVVAGAGLGPPGAGPRCPRPGSGTRGTRPPGPLAPRARLVGVLEAGVSSRSAPIDRGL